MKPHHLEYCEFYITNVCNLNCDDCNRFNNYAFSGHQSWNMYSDIYRQWSEILSINKISILGGEPMLNPDFMSWVTGIANLWPDVMIKIISNGSQLHRWPQLYDVMCQYGGRIWLEINVHDQFHFDQTVNWFHRSFLRGQVGSWHDHVWKKSYERIRDPSWPDCAGPQSFNNLPQSIRGECQSMGLNNTLARPDSYDMIDENQVRVAVCRAWHFFPSAVQFDGQQLTLHNSDPKKAMAACFFKICHHFIRGSLYKCGPVGILPEFLQQFPMMISDADKKLINEYSPARPDWTHQNLSKFIKNLRDADAIDQCKFCPENTDQFRKISSGTKKIAIKKVSMTNG